MRMPVEHLQAQLAERGVEVRRSPYLPNEYLQVTAASALHVSYVRKVSEPKGSGGRPLRSLRIPA
jgi:hypothetical protein